MNVFKSIKFRLQLWYGLLLLVALVGLGAAAYHIQQGQVYARLDSEIQRRAGNVANVIRMNTGGRQPQGPQGQGFPRGPGQMGRPGMPDVPGGFDGPPEGIGEPRNQPDGPPDGPPDGMGNPDPAPADPPKNLRLPPRVASLFDEADPNGFYYFIIWRDGREVLRSTNAPSLDRSGLRPTQAPPPGRGGRDQGVAPQPQNIGNYREAMLMTPPGEAIIVGHSILAERVELRGIALKLGAFITLIMGVGLAGGWWFASRVIRPIADISSAADKIATGDLSQRIQTGDHGSELGQLAVTLNSTFARLENSFAQQAQFTSDAAHELRTPVSVILTQAQSTLKKERTAQEYRETLEACERAASRMRRLTDSLLQLARLDAGQENIRRERFDLATVAQNCAAHIKPLAAPKNVTVTAETEPAFCVGDSERMAQVVTNLLNNAINYNKPDGEIRVGVRAEGKLAVLTVTDSGVGISNEDLPKVFERFFRGDKSRTGSGNAGLGLAICQAIVEAHGGEMDVTSELSVGTTFSVRLPLVA